MPDAKSSTLNPTELSWPRSPAAILIMGKRQGTKKENKQLWGRAAMAALLWYSAPDPKPYLLFVASDVHGPNCTPDAQVVKTLLVEKFKISADFVMLRPVSNCTLIEVRATRAISRSYRLSRIFAVTHLYHAPRAQRYLDEVLPNAAVIPVHPEVLAELSLPAEHAAIFLTAKPLIDQSLPGRFDLLREYVIETLLNYAHTIDRRGRFERRLAHWLRPTAYR